jgi:hypothetical protein
MIRNQKFRTQFQWSIDPEQNRRQAQHHEGHVTGVADNDQVGEDA